MTDPASSLPFARTDALKHGDVVVVAAPGFSCFRPGEVHVVSETRLGMLYCWCRYGGTHPLDAHVSADGAHFLGFFKIDDAKTAAPKNAASSPEAGRSGLSALFDTIIVVPTSQPNLPVAVRQVKARWSGKSATSKDGDCGK